MPHWLIIGFCSFGLSWFIVPLVCHGLLSLWFVMVYGPKGFAMTFVPLAGNGSLFVVYVVILPVMNIVFEIS
jgi:hypothetical protein